jgi:hypothetical protein
MQKKAIAKLETTFIESSLFDTGDLSEQLQDAREHLTRLETGLRRKKNTLGVGEQANLHKLQQDAFLRLRMNALALKCRLRDRLRQRKFEIEKLERSYRRSVNGMYILPCQLTHQITILSDAKLQGHVETSLKRREPTIVKLAKNYNDLCRQIQDLIRRGKAPLGALAPKEIERDRLFNLDVDDDIWQDTGLDDDYDGDDAPPRWLSDERVRQGIKSMLEFDRCNEEEMRLIRERCAMQEWMQEEWNINLCAYDAAGRCLLVIAVDPA